MSARRFHLVICLCLAAVALSVHGMVAGPGMAALLQLARHVAAELSAHLLSHVGFAATEWAVLVDGLRPAQFAALLTQLHLHPRREMLSLCLPPCRWSVARLLRRRHDRGHCVPFQRPRCMRLGQSLQVLLCRRSRATGALPAGAFSLPPLRRLLRTCCDRVRNAEPPSACRRLLPL